MYFKNSSWSPESVLHDYYITRRARILRSFRHESLHDSAFLSLKIRPRRFLPPKGTEFEFNTRIIPRKRCLWFSNGGRRRESGLVFLQE